MFYILYGVVFFSFFFLSLVEVQVSTVLENVAMYTLDFDSQMKFRKIVPWPVSHKKVLVLYIYIVLLVGTVEAYCVYLAI